MVTAEWYCKCGARQIGPLTNDQLVAMAREGKLSAQDSVRVGTAGPWIAARAIKGLFDDGTEHKPASKPSRPQAKSTSVGSGSTSTSASSLPASRRVVFRPAGPLPPSVPSPPKSDAPVRRYVIPMPVELKPAESLRSVAADYLQRHRSQRNTPVLIACVAILLLTTGVLGGVLLNSLALRSASRNAEAGPLDAIPALANVDQWHAPETNGLGITDVVHIEVHKPWAAREVTGQSGNVTGNERLPNRYVFVEIEVTNLSKRESINYSSWNQSLNNAGVAPPVLVDASGFRMGLVPAAETPGHTRKQIEVLEPRETIKDTLVFYAPSADFRRMRLVLPFSSFGRGGRLGIEIPGYMLEQAGPNPISVGREAPAGRGADPDEHLPAIDRATRQHDSNRN